MATSIWGLLKKSLTDSELIEEAIARLITDHDNDPTSHLGETGSLQSHKASEIIDHEVGSVVSDKLQDWIEGTFLGSFGRTDFHWSTIFESLDGYGILTKALCIPTSAGIYMGTGAISNASNYLYRNIEHIPNFNFDRDTKVSFNIEFWNTANQYIHIVNGSADPTLGTNIIQHIGFKVIDNVLYGTCGNGTAETTLTLCIISASTQYGLAYSRTSSGVEFFVNGVSIGIITTHIPAYIGNAKTVIYISIRTNGEAVTKNINVNYYDFWQAA